MLHATGHATSSWCSLLNISDHHVCILSWHALLVSMLHGWLPSCMVCYVSMLLYTTFFTSLISVKGTGRDLFSIHIGCVTLDAYYHQPNPHAKLPVDLQLLVSVNAYVSPSSSCTPDTTCIYQAAYFVTSGSAAPALCSVMMGLESCVPCVHCGAGS